MKALLQKPKGQRGCRFYGPILDRTKARRLKKRLVFTLFGIIAILNLNACGPPTHDAKSMRALFENRKAPVLDNYTTADRLIHFAEVQSPGKLLIVFLHGTPGSWYNWAHYMADENLSAQTHLIAVDRPGFGMSAAEGVVLSLKAQAEYLRPIFNRNTSGGGTLLVGHSLGATIAVRMAMEYPDQICGLVLVAPSLVPALEKPRWYNKLAALPLIRRLIPRKMQLANKEVMVLAEELKKMLPLWHDLKTPVTVIQGGKDRLVLPANADFAEKMLRDNKPKIIRIAEAGHFILWENPDIIRDAILSARDHDCQTNTVKPG